MIRLTDDQWGRIRQHFPEEHIPDGRAGRKPIPTRRVLEAALWILNTGAQWHMLPQSYPNYKTVHRRSGLVPRRGFATSADGRRQRASRQRRWMKKSVSSMRPS
jgi:transposase